MYKFTFLALLLCPFWLFSQVVPITILDEQNKPVEAASVQLMRASDSTLLKVELSAADGTVLFNVLPKEANYVFFVQLLGYESQWIHAQEAMNNRQIQLKSTDNTLGEVTIKARKPVYEMRADKLVVNVENSTLATGNTALELLRKSPGVVVDQNDNLALRGKNGVRVFLDGKPSPLGGAELAAFLQGMQASDIEAIEIIANPSARFDAAGNAGIINIRLKKNKNYGVNGSLSIGNTQGLYNRSNGNLSLNYRNRAVNIFGSYGANGGQNWNFFNFFRRQNGYVFDQKTETVTDNLNQNLKIGADWSLNKQHTLGINLNGFLNLSDSRAVTAAPIALAATPDQIDELLLTRSTREGDRRNGNINLNHTWSNGKGRSLATDFDYGHFNLFSSELVPNRYVQPANPAETLTEITFLSETPTGIDLFSFKTDWEQSLGQQLNLSVGLKTARVITDNTFNFFNVVNQQNELDGTRSNQFTYDEQIHAAYGQLSREKGPWNWQIGLRTEYTRSNGDLRTDNDIADKNVTRNYLDWFPSASAGYQMNANTKWSLAYSRRIDRPVYADLNPFEYRINELTYYKGNPFLLPQYTHNIELSHSWKWTLNTSLSYSYVNNYFANVSDTIEERRSFLRRENFDRQDVLSLSTSYPFQLTKWWSGFASVSTDYARYRAEFAPGKFVRIDNYAANLYAQNSFKVQERWSVELSGSYSSPNVWGGTYRNRYFWFVDAGLQYKHERLTVRMVLADVFLSMRWRGVAEIGGLYAVASGGWDSRQLRLNATYNFGKSTVKKARQRNSGADDLKQRVE
jgi:iron complex outermembrane recepter protein